MLNRWAVCWLGSLPTWAIGPRLHDCWASVAILPGGAELKAMLSIWVKTQICFPTANRSINWYNCYRKQNRGSKKIKNRTFI